MAIPMPKWESHLTPTLGLLTAARFRRMPASEVQAADGVPCAYWTVPGTSARSVLNQVRGHRQGFVDQLPAAVDAASHDVGALIGIRSHLEVTGVLCHMDLVT